MTKTKANDIVYEEEGLDESELLFEEADIDGEEYGEESDDDVYEDEGLGDSDDLFEEGDDEDGEDAAEDDEEGEEIEDEETLYFEVDPIDLYVAVMTELQRVAWLAANFEAFTIVKKAGDVFERWIDRAEPYAKLHNGIADAAMTKVLKEEFVPTEQAPITAEEWVAQLDRLMPWEEKLKAATVRAQQQLEATGSVEEGEQKGEDEKKGEGERKGESKKIRWIQLDLLKKTKQPTPVEHSHRVD